MKNKTITFICHSSANILYSLKLIHEMYRLPEYSKINLILSEWVDDSIRVNFTNYINNYDERVVVYYLTELNFKKKFYFFYKKEIIKTIFNEIGLKKDSEIVLFLDVFPSGTFVLEKFNDVTLAYEGALYIRSNEIYKNYLRLLKLKPRSWGHSSKIKNIIVENKKLLPNILQKKALLFDYNKMNYSFNKKEVLIKLFGLDQSINIIGNSVLILTQPFYIEKLLTIENQKNMYMNICCDYRKFNIYIKPHPRDLINYDYLEGFVNILPKHFPIELFNLFDFKFDKIISIDSASMSSLQGLGEIKLIGRKFIERFCDD